MQAWRRLTARRFALAMGAIAALQSAALAQAPRPKSPPPAQAVEAATARRLVVAVPTTFDTLDPHLVLDTPRAAIRLNFYDALYRWEDSPVRVAPWLAQSYTISEDGKTYRFTLRQGARFHDGSVMSSADVVYSVERILALKRGPAPLLAALVNPGATKAIDPATVEFSLTRPSPLFLTLLPEVHVVNAKLLRSHEVNNDWGRAWLANNEAGSGAYVLKSHSPISVVATRFAEHWQNTWSRAPVATVELRTSLDTEASIEALVKGDVQVVAGPLLAHQKKRIKESKDLTLGEDDGPRLFAGIVNAQRESLKTPALRRVLALAFDYDTFLHATLGAGAVRAPLPLPPAYASAAAGAGARFDLQAARAELAKIKTAPANLTIGAVAGDPHSESAAVIMMQGLAALGIPARIVAEPWPAVAERMRDEKQMYDMLFLWQGTRYLDPNNWVGEMYDCDLFGAGNSSWYCNKEADRLIKEARVSTDPKARVAAYEKAAGLVAADFGGLFIASARATLAHAKRIKGLRIAPAGETFDLRAVTME